MTTAAAPITGPTYDRPKTPPATPRRRAATLRSLTDPGLSAVRRFWRPFLLLQGLALLLVVGYAVSPAARAACGRLTVFKAHAGLAFAAVTAAAAGAVLPEAAKFAVLGDRRFDRRRLRNMGFAAVAFALNGVITDLQYRGMSAVFGDARTPGTVLAKVLADQFVTTPLYGCPYWLVVYALRSNRYRPWRTVRQLTPRWYARTVLPLLLANWAFWIPMSLMIYSLPGALQFCLFLVAAAAWSLLMVFVATGEAAKNA